MGKARQEWPQGARPAIQGFSADPFLDLRRNISPSMVAAKTALVERSGIGLIVTSISLKLMVVAKVLPGIRKPNQSNVV